MGGEIGGVHSLKQLVTVVNNFIQHHAHRRVLRKLTHAGKVLELDLTAVQCHDGTLLWHDTMPKL